MTVYAKMTGRRRFTLDELRVLQVLAERGLDAIKLEGAREIPYGAAPLTERACHAIIGALQKVDAALNDVEHRAQAARGAPPLPLDLRESTYLPLLDSPRKPLRLRSQRGGAAG